MKIKGNHFLNRTVSSPKDLINLKANKQSKFCPSGKVRVADSGNFVTYVVKRLAACLRLDLCLHRNGNRPCWAELLFLNHRQISPGPAEWSRARSIHCLDEAFSLKSICLAYWARSHCSGGWNKTILVTKGRKKDKHFHLEVTLLRNTFACEDELRT